MLKPLLFFSTPFLITAIKDKVVLQTETPVATVIKRKTEAYTSVEPGKLKKRRISWQDQRNIAPKENEGNEEEEDIVASSQEVNQQF